MLKANANCAVMAVRELYKRGYIEKFGERNERYEEVAEPENKIGMK